MQNQKTSIKGLPTIGLSIIVKNEAKVIERMLNTVHPILDYYCVVDTGSTDGTQDIIRKFFEEKGIPGEVIDHQWVNFQEARNTALNAVKGKADFGFWIDADEQLTFDPRFNLMSLKMTLAKIDGGNVKVTYGDQNYYRMQFFRTEKPWYWYGPVHEVLISDEQMTSAEVPGLGVLVTPDGNSWTSESIQSKYEGHAKILEDYVANDPKKDPRWLFYLAQSYRDAAGEENLKKSLHWYTKRMENLTGFWEEVYYSGLMAATIKAQLNYPVSEIIEDYLKIGKMNIYRCEHLIPIIMHYHAIKEFDIAYIFSSHAMNYAGKSPFPKATLFIDKNTYLWKIYDLHCLSCFYSGRKEEGDQTFKKLLKAKEKGFIPAQELPRIEQNKQWFIKNKNSK
jgi:glycosyltransferase involved in cell wall biosynthesis